MRVYDWAAVAKPRWFISDGIHYTSAGYTARSRLIARALAAAFPAAPPVKLHQATVGAGAGRQRGGDAELPGALGLAGSAD